MFVRIELKNGPRASDFVDKVDIQRNIEALQRAAKIMPTADMILIQDTVSIMRSIQLQLPNRNYTWP